MTPEELVLKVYSAQHNVRLEDFEPTDDKYKEVIEITNMVLGEFQKEQDWSFLRERVILGHIHHGHQIPEFEIPHDKFYKPATQPHDCVKLYRPHPHHGHYRRPHGSDYYEDIYSRDSSKQNHHQHNDMELDERDFIIVDWENASSINRKTVNLYDHLGQVYQRDHGLYATFIGNTVTFNRPPRGRELGRIAVTDYIKRIKPLHVCDESCVEKYWSKDIYCPLIEDEVLPGMPDPTYIVHKVAKFMSDQDPVVTQARRDYLDDTAKKMLSALREHDSDSTSPEFMDYAEYGYFEVT